MKTKFDLGVLNHSDKIKKRTILFVCTGNTCRSPMCAALYNDRYSRGNSRAFSRGISADGSSISQNTVCALEDFGVISTDSNDYKNHVSNTVCEDDVKNADSIVCVSPNHMIALILRFPAYASKITSFSRPINDPYGGDIGEYKKCLSDIDESLTEMFLGNCNEL